MQHLFLCLWYFCGLHNLLNGDKKKHYAIAIGAIGLMLCHTVTTLYTAIFSIIYLLFHIKKLKQKEVWKKIAINVIFILLTTMLFWGPMLEAKMTADYAILDDSIMSTNSEYASKHTLEFSQFVKDKEEEFGTTFIIGTPILILILCSFFIARKVDKEHKDNYLIFMILGIISFIMCTKLFPWSIMPNILCKLQYPWRMEGFFILFMSLVCGINLYLLLQKLFKGDMIKIVVITIITAVCVLETNYIMRQFYTKDPQADEKYENYILKMVEEEITLTHWNINRDYLPVKAIRQQKTYMDQREEKTYILEGNANIVKEEKKDLTSYLEIEKIEKNTVLEFQYLYYPGYKVTIQKDNQEIEIKPEESKNGYVSIKIPSDMEKTTITVKYVGTTIIKLSYLISAISFIVFAIYIVILKRRDKREK